MIAINNINLTQQAYIAAHNTYEAHGTDKQGHEYLFQWDVICTDSDDESNACDWDNPTSITQI